MGRRWRAPLALLAAALLVLASNARAQQAGDDVSGVISSVDSRTLTVTRAGAAPVTARIGTRTHVVVSPGGGGHYPDATIEFLKQGMAVRFRYASGVLDRVQVTSVPAGAWPDTEGEPVATEPSRPVKGRVVRVDARGGVLVAEVDGREETLYADDRKLLADLQPGDRPTLQISDRNGRKVIIAIR